MTKAISLSAELTEVRCAIEGARVLAGALATHSLDSQEQELRAPVSITAILVLAELRLHQVERVLRGEEAPQHLWAPHNDVPPGGAVVDEQDVVLRPWNRAEEDAAAPSRKKTGRSGPRRRRGQAPTPEAEPAAHPEGGSERPPPPEATS